MQILGNGPNGLWPYAECWRRERITPRAWACSPLLRCFHWDGGKCFDSVFFLFLKVVQEDASEGIISFIGLSLWIWDAFDLNGMGCSWGDYFWTYSEKEKQANVHFKHWPRCVFKCAWSTPQSCHCTFRATVCLSLWNHTDYGKPLSITT